MLSETQAVQKPKQEAISHAPMIVGMLVSALLLAVLILRVIRDAKRTKEADSVRQRELAAIDGTLMRAIQTENWGFLIQAAVIEQGHNAERKMSASMSIPMHGLLISALLSFYGLAWWVTELRDMVPMVSVAVFLASCAIVVAHGRAVERFTAEQRRRTKFQVEILEKILSGEAKMDPDA